MQITVEKCTDGTFLVQVPCKSKKKEDKGNYIEYRPDLKYTAENEKEALKIIAEALKEVEVPEDEYGIAYEEAIKS